MIDPTENSIIGWIVRNQIKTAKGEVYDFRSHPFFYDILRDWSPNLLLWKAAQLGGTTAMSLKLLWAMKRFGLDCVYTFPTSQDASLFVSGQLNPLISQNPVLMDYVKDKDSVEQKRIGANTAHFKGTMTERAAISFPSDLNVHDEEDRSNPLIVAQYASRQQHSKFKWTWRLSNPSVPGGGVAQYWDESDKKHWFIMCDTCKKEQYLSWPDSIDPDRKAFVCKQCDNVLGDRVRYSGRWIPLGKGTKYSGYWLSLLMAPWVSAEEILEMHRTKTPEYFHNFVLGLPYAGSGNKLNESEFFANLREDINSYSDPIILGVDSGLPNYYVIGNKEGIFFNGSCEGWKEIHEVMKRFPKAIAVCDQGGDLYGQRELQETFPGRVYLCWFRPDRKTLRLIDWGSKEDVGGVVADRNRVIQQVMDEFRTQRIPIFGNKEDWLEVWHHFANMYREKDEDGSGNERFVWKRAGPDHFALCITYWRIGLSKFENDDGVRVVGVDHPLEKFVGKIRIAPEITYDGHLKIPKASREARDWRDVD